MPPPRLSVFASALAMALLALVIGAPPSHAAAIRGHRSVPGAVEWLGRYKSPGTYSTDDATAVASSPDSSTVYVTGSGGGYYDDTWHGIEEAHAIAVAPDGSLVFVTGDSARSPSNYQFDHATLAYHG